MKVFRRVYQVFISKQSCITISHTYRLCFPCCLLELKGSLDTTGQSAHRHHIGEMFPLINKFHSSLLWFLLSPSLWLEINRHCCVHDEKVGTSPSLSVDTYIICFYYVLLYPSSAAAAPILIKCYMSSQPTHVVVVHNFVLASSLTKTVLCISI